VRIQGTVALDRDHLWRGYTGEARVDGGGPPDEEDTACGGAQSLGLDDDDPAVLQLQERKFERGVGGVASGARYGPEQNRQPSHRSWSRLSPHFLECAEVLRSEW